MDSIGDLVRAGRLFSLSQPKSAPPEAESERDRAAHNRETLEGPQGDTRDRLEPFRERVARAVDRIEQRAQIRVDRLQAALDSDRIEPAALQERLTDRFGDRAHDIISEDGQLDKDRLRDLFARIGLRHLRERIDAFREDREPESEPALDPEAAPEPGSVISIEA